MRQMLTVKESAEQLGLSEKTIWAWIYARRIEFIRLGRSVRISRATIDDLIAAGTIPAKAS